MRPAPAVITGFLTGALANTEAISFVHRNLPGAGVPLTVGPPTKTLLEDHTRLSLNAPDGRYFVRVCWPASQPADFELEYDAPDIVIHRKPYGVPLNNESWDVEIAVVASSIVYGLPSDVWPIVSCIVLVLGSTLCAIWLKLI